MANDQQQLIIKKVKKGGHGGHHGGGWKVAYADFVTSMMAFFLLLWLLNATSEEQKLGITNYFAPIGATQGGSASNGILGGTSAVREGTLISTLNAPPNEISTRNIHKTPEEDDHKLETSKAGQGSNQDVAPDEEGASQKDSVEFAQTARDIRTAKKREEGSSNSDDEIKKLLAKREEENFKKIEKDLKEAIEKDPELKSLAKNLLIDETPEGLRIQIIDQAQYPMFASGSSDLYPYATKILEKISKVVSQVTNPISIVGHTDASGGQDATGKKNTNWEISADRANAARRSMIAGGLEAKRISSVIGKADVDPLVKEDLSAPQNRRISVILARQAGSTSSDAKKI